MRRITTTLSVYMIKEFMKWLLIVLLFVSILAGLLEYSELARRASSYTQIVQSDILKMMFLKIPNIVEELMPFVIFFSTMLALWRLNRNSELTVMRASGISAWQFLLPISITCLIIGFLDLGAINPISSVFKKKYDRLDETLFHKISDRIEISESGIWIRQKIQDDEAIFHIDRYEQSNQTLQGVSILFFNSHGKFSETMRAPLATIDNDKVILKDVWVVKNGEAAVKKPLVELSTQLTIAKLLKRNAAPDSLSFWELSKFIYILESSGLLKPDYKLYWHSLIAKIFWLFSMVYLAAASSLGFIRNNKTAYHFMLGIATTFVVYVLKDVTYVMGAASTIPFLVAAWIPALMTFLSGVSVLLHTEDG